MISLPSASGQVYDTGVPYGNGTVGRRAETGRDNVGRSSVADGLMVGNGRPELPVRGGIVMLRSGIEIGGKEGRPGTLKVGREGHKLEASDIRLPL